jgi:Ca2+-binding EF-hand superfamily protein
MPPPLANTLYALAVVAIVLVPLLAGLLLLYRRCLFEADRKGQRKAVEEEREKKEKDEAQKVLVGWLRQQNRTLKTAKLIDVQKVKEAEEEERKMAKRVEDYQGIRLRRQLKSVWNAWRTETRLPFTAEDDEVIWKEMKRFRNAVMTHRMLDKSEIEAVFRLIDKNGDGALSRAEVIKACRANEKVHTLLGLPKNIRQEDGTRDLFEVVFQKLDADDSKSITLDEFSKHLRKSRSSHNPDPADQIWEKISDKLGRSLANGVRIRYLELREPRDSNARANWQILIREVRGDQRVAISWRGLVDAWREHKEEKRKEETEKLSKASGSSWNIFGAAKSPTFKTPAADLDEFDHGREEWRFPLSTNPNLDFFYSLRRQFSPRKYIPVDAPDVWKDDWRKRPWALDTAFVGRESKDEIERAPDKWWDKETKSWRHLPAMKHKALCKLRLPALAHRPPGYGALFNTERGGSDSSRQPRVLTRPRGRLQDLSRGTPRGRLQDRSRGTPRERLQDLSRGTPHPNPNPNPNPNQNLSRGTPTEPRAASPLYARPDTTPQRRPSTTPINDTPINDTQLRLRLAVFHDNGWQAVNVGGDGNCFFRALAKQVYLDEQEHRRARQETIQYMRDRREDFEQYVPKDFDSYVDLMSREGTYIEGQVEIKAAANAFNVCIKVYGRSREHDTTFAPLIINSETRDVYMAHYQAAQHYVVLERMDPALTARGGLSRSMLASGGLDSSNSSRARRQDSRGTPTARRLPPASARAPGEIVLEMATPLGRPRDELDA